MGHPDVAESRSLASIVETMTQVQDGEPCNDAKTIITQMKERLRGRVAAIDSSDTVLRAKIVYVEDRLVVFSLPGWEYEISLDECNTHEKMLGCVERLIEKRWASRGIIEAFMRLVRKHNDVHGKRP